MAQLRVDEKITFSPGCRIFWMYFMSLVQIARARVKGSFTSGLFAEPRLLLREPALQRVDGCEHVDRLRENSRERIAVLEHPLARRLDVVALELEPSTHVLPLKRHRHGRLGQRPHA